MNDDLNRISDANLIHFYREELTYIRDGGTASDIFTETKRRSLIRKGVLVRQNLGEGRLKAILSDSARTILETTE